MALRDVQQMLGQWYHLNLGPVLAGAHSYNYVRKLAAGLAGILVVGGAFWGHRLWIHQRETAAQVALAEATQFYRDTVQSKSTSADAWSRAAVRYSSDHDRYKKSAYAPYFLIMEAEALARQAKVGEAIVVLDSGIAALAKDSPVASLYKTKRALMKLDVPGHEAEGLEELKALANDKENRNSDVARYYLGLYYWSRDDFQNAQDAWYELVTSQRHERLGSSAWADMARMRLSQRVQLPEDKPIEAPGNS